MSLDLKGAYSPVFVLSTGRCGTQWLYDVFSHNSDSNLVVTHEPIGDFYDSRAQLSHQSVVSFLKNASYPLKEHIKDIKSVVASKIYLETGFPCWSSLQFLHEEFENGIRIIHVKRHPIQMMSSWLKLDAYKKPFLPHQVEKILLDPSDNCSFKDEYQKIWQQLSRKDKLLFFWMEVNNHAQYLTRNLKIPSISIAFEDLFTTRSIQEICNFIGVNFCSLGDIHFDKKIDNFDLGRGFYIEEGPFYSHPNLSDLALSLGYSLDAN